MSRILAIRDILRHLIRATYNTNKVYVDMDDVYGSGIWSTIARKVVGAALKGVAGITTKQVANKAGNAILDGTSSAVRKHAEKMVDDIMNKKKKKKKHQFRRYTIW